MEVITSTLICFAPCVDVSAQGSWSHIPEKGRARRCKMSAIPGYEMREREKK